MTLATRGIIFQAHHSTGKDKHPDITDFQREELVKSLNLEHHISLLYKSDSADKINEALDDAAEKSMHIILAFFLLRQNQHPKH